MTPWDQWRVDFNERIDRLGEDKLSKMRVGRPKNASYDDRIARVREDGGASGAVSGAPKARIVPPPPPGVPSSHASLGGGAAAPGSAPATTHIQFSQFTDADKQAFFGLLDEVRHAHVLYLNDQFFAKRTDAGQIVPPRVRPRLLTRRGPDRLADAFDDSARLVPVGHGLCSVVVKAPFSSRSVVETGGAAGWVCLKQVDVDAQNAPHDVEKEVALLSQLRHPHLVTLLAAFTDTPDSFTTVWNLAMPLYPVRLTDVLNDERLARDAERPVGARGVVPFVHGVLEEVVSAVAYLHAERVAHRDIKPGNVLLTADGHAVLIDLGVAWRPGADSAGATRAQVSEVGSGAFRAPELLFAPTRGYDAYAADMWSLGCLLASFFTWMDEDPADAPPNDMETDDNVTPWERELWGAHAPPARGPRPVQRTRKTLFNASRGDIGLAGDIFMVLGLPSTYEAWPESEHFQPPLPEFPFVHQRVPTGVWPRLPGLAQLEGAPAGKALHALVSTWLPRLLTLSASQRPRAVDMLQAVRAAAL
ncbi:hypothetical protein MSPP1_000853 [Malassezia sp. CBS 17886]|nr:hypothetical protein MSPP1_000853 [Malassezia sp. CBS 17886]